MYILITFEEGSDRHSIIRDVLEGEHVGVGDLLAY
jgi:predicted transport protein